MNQATGNVVRMPNRIADKLDTALLLMGFSMASSLITAGVVTYVVVKTESQPMDIRVLSWLMAGSGSSLVCALPSIFMFERYFKRANRMKFQADGPKS